MVEFSEGNPGPRGGSHPRVSDSNNLVALYGDTKGKDRRDNTRDNRPTTPPPQDKPAQPKPGKDNTPPHVVPKEFPSIPGFHPGRKDVTPPAVIPKPGDRQPTVGPKPGDRQPTVTPKPGDRQPTVTPKPGERIPPGQPDRTPRVFPGRDTVVNPPLTPRDPNAPLVQPPRVDFPNIKPSNPKDQPVVPKTPGGRTVVPPVFPDLPGKKPADRTPPPVQPKKDVTPTPTDRFPNIPGLQPGRKDVTPPTVTPKEQPVIPSLPKLTIPTDRRTPVTPQRDLVPQRPVQPVLPTDSNPGGQQPRTNNIGRNLVNNIVRDLIGPTGGGYGPGGYNPYYPQSNRYYPQSNLFPGRQSGVQGILNTVVNDLINPGGGGYDPRYPQYDPRYPQYDPRYPQYDPRYPQYDPRTQYDPRYPQYDPRTQYDPRYPQYDPRTQYDPRYPQYQPRPGNRNLVGTIVNEVVRDLINPGGYTPGCGPSDCGPPRYYPDQYQPVPSPGMIPQDFYPQDRYPQDRGRFPRLAPNGPLRNLVRQGINDLANNPQALEGLVNTLGRALGPDVRLNLDARNKQINLGMDFAKLYDKATEKQGNQANPEIRKVLSGLDSINLNPDVLNLNWKQEQLLTLDQKDGPAKGFKVLLGGGTNRTTFNIDTTETQITLSNIQGLEAVDPTGRRIKIHSVRMDTSDPANPKGSITLDNPVPKPKQLPDSVPWPEQVALPILLNQPEQKQIAESLPSAIRTINSMRNAIKSGDLMQLRNNLNPQDLMKLIGSITQPKVAPDVPPPPKPGIVPDVPPPPKPGIVPDVPPPPKPGIVPDVPPPPKPGIVPDVPPPPKPGIVPDVPLIPVPPKRDPELVPPPPKPEVKKDDTPPPPVPPSDSQPGTKLTGPSLRPRSGLLPLPTDTTPKDPPKEQPKAPPAPGKRPIDLANVDYLNIPLPGDKKPAMPPSKTPPGQEKTPPVPEKTPPVPDKTPPVPKPPEGETAPPPKPPEAKVKPDTTKPGGSKTGDLLRDSGVKVVGPDKIGPDKLFSLIFADADQTGPLVKGFNQKLTDTKFRQNLETISSTLNRFEVNKPNKSITVGMDFAKIYDAFEPDLPKDKKSPETRDFLAGLQTVTLTPESVRLQLKGPGKLPMEGEGLTKADLWLGTNNNETTMDIKTTETSLTLKNIKGMQAEVKALGKRLNIHEVNIDTSSGKPVGTVVVDTPFDKPPGIPEDKWSRTMTLPLPFGKTPAEQAEAAEQMPKSLKSFHAMRQGAQEGKLVDRLGTFTKEDIIQMLKFK